MHHATIMRMIEAESLKQNILFIWTFGVAHMYMYMYMYMYRYMHTA